MSSQLLGSSQLEPKLAHYAATSNAEAAFLKASAAPSVRCTSGWFGANALNWLQSKIYQTVSQTHHDFLCS